MLFRLGKLTAVISACKWQLDKHYDTISYAVVHDYVQHLQDRTDHYILDGFSCMTVSTFFRNHPYYFQRTAILDRYDEPVYRIRHEVFENIIANMVKYFDLENIDPPREHPEDIRRLNGLEQYCKHAAG